MTTSLELRRHQKPQHSTYKKWIAENNMVMSWLVNSMTTDIGENFLSFDTAKEIWDIAKELSQTRKTHLKSSRLKASSTICVKETLRKSGHSRGNLLEIHGKPIDWKPPSTT
ncbi:hypothetical protein CK203_096860 [Vitis vinifera]|uniref:Retrotransposon Copia-like N-terminal domain-containing protein n=1 Tax=Vitis vinifera TaxID=29760 RepID=A0A438BPT2_VITVI|nr:hypothetical protein CK203_096860 [Vitis vinifera]